MAFSHTTVLLYETCNALSIKPNGVYVDCTLGGGGHAEVIASRLGTRGRLIAIDCDPQAMTAARARLISYQDRITYVLDNFCNMASILKSYAPDGIDGAIIDLGVSSHQLDSPERGFSYHSADAPLDMRMSQVGKSAADVVNTYSQSELKRIISQYGEERFANRIAKEIVQRRETMLFSTTGQLADAIKSAIPGGYYEDKHPARRTFQAIRIEVNNELDIIPPTLMTLVEALKIDGILAVITFHSLEDRAVKETFQRYVEGCTCPRDFPVCICGFKPKLKILNRKPMVASKEELETNSRSRSAKLRTVQKI
jgi:16S rRNA (cytosine1402-N4)-methyltransferase